MHCFPPRTLSLTVSRTCLIKGRGLHVCLQTSYLTPQNITTRLVAQRASNHSEELYWKDSQFISSLLSLQHSRSHFLPPAPKKGVADQPFLPFLNSSSSVAEDIKQGQSNPALMLLFSHFTTGSHAKGDGASKHAAAKTAATAEQKSCPKHRAPDMGSKQNGLMLAPKLEIKNTMCKSTSCKYTFKTEALVAEWPFCFL